MRRHRRRSGDESVRAAYSRHLRAMQLERDWVAWSPLPRRAADLESGRPVAVRFWEIERFAPELRLDSDQWVRLVGDDVVPVDPVRSPDGLRIIGWRPVAA